MHQTNQKIKNKFDYLLNILVIILIFFFNRTNIGFGRFNPPHAGHGQLMDLAAESAMETEGDYIIVPSRTNDPKKNPLDADLKVSTMRSMFPDHAERIINDPQNNTIFDVLKKAHNDGYANVRLIGGEDRVKQFDKLSQNYNGQLYQFDGLEAISSGQRDEDKEGLEGYSASRMRLAAMEGDFKTFYNQLHKEVHVSVKSGLFCLNRVNLSLWFS